MPPPETSSIPPATPADPTVGPAVRDELLRALAIDGGAQGRDIARTLHARIPELADVREQRAMLAETEACCGAHVEEILGLLEGGGTLDDVAVPDCGREYAAGFVHRRIPLPVLMRAYRFGQNHLWETFAGRLRTLGDPAAGEGLRIATALLFEYVDRVARDATEVYQDERDGWIRSAAAVRAETVEALLAGEEHDVDVAGRRLGYGLRGTHTALIVSADPAGPSVAPGVLERTARAAVAAVGGGEPLLVPSSTTAVRAWAQTPGVDADEVDARIARLRPVPGVRVSVGRPADDLDGFRVSHEEARHAADLHGDLQGAAASYRSVELVSLLGADPERARRFVERELGPLARGDEVAAGLRETALAFLDHGGSHIGAAASLHVHKNTVYTRIRRAERELGVPVAPGRAALHAALTLAVRTPGRVIAPTPPAPPG
ncbi:CdaR family transcriptional regulator [Patulibacter sp.]|uniref:PucR family transcriptional regulator n=1 Tax=Patulibacter sp. TaxID=1912859 RepID=UPI002716F9CE|nr:helix-turn-helix domain-containing protein [Patulibacter sp.]MDO9408158.1 helix-turn-helix domain-containing protein [Patulibacter sp.]